jgi:hypothetical protein
MSVGDNSRDTFARETITVAGTAVGVTAATARTAFSDAAKVAVLSVETAPIRFTVDGTAATTSVGFLLNPGDTVTITGRGDIESLSMIRTTSTSASVQAAYAR